jgi:ssDNA-binding Zn-finger/Zn-ribbon topoisomerase 1
MMLDPNMLPLGTKLEHPCPECGSAMVLRTSKFGPFYGCIEYPKCKAAHGAHADGRPLGTPADAVTKKARIQAHDAFDELWKGGAMSRREAYAWMQRAMGLSKDDAHIGKFTADQCDKLKTLVGKYMGERCGARP